jgi:hypothetical protein
MKQILPPAALSEGAGRQSSEQSTARQSTNASRLLTRRMCTTTRPAKRSGGASSSHMPNGCQAGSSSGGYGCEEALRWRCGGGYELRVMHKGEDGDEEGGRAEVFSRGGGRQAALEEGVCRKGYTFENQSCLVKPFPALPRHHARSSCSSSVAPAYPEPTSSSPCLPAAPHVVVL